MEATEASSRAQYVAPDRESNPLPTPPTTALAGGMNTTLCHVTQTSEALGVLAVLLEDNKIIR